MKLGIVGHGADKFTPETALLAKARIRANIKAYSAQLVVSGRSPLGGVDIWAEEIAHELSIPTLIFPASTNQWDGPGGFKYRNLQIAHNSDVVLCVVVKSLPPSYQGRRFEYCYHCRTQEHVKSGGCWTGKQAKACIWEVVESKQ